MGQSHKTTGAGIQLRRRIAGVVGFIFLLVSWGGGFSVTAAALAKTSDPQIVQKLFVDAPYIWNRLEIEVCWNSSVDLNDEAVKWAKEAVENTLYPVSDFRFTSWQHCNFLKRPRARIEISLIDSADERPNSLVGMQKIPGTWRDGPTTMKLNFALQHWSCYSIPLHPSTTLKMNCVQVVAVHEFIHALGALHEQVDPDTARLDPECAKQYTEKFDKFGKPTDDYGTNPVSLTGYDHDSIMNYCRKIYLEPLRLSENDKIGLRKLSDLSRIKFQKSQ